MTDKKMTEQELGAIKADFNFGGNGYSKGYLEYRKVNQLLSHIAALDKAYAILVAQIVELMAERNDAQARVKELEDALSEWDGYENV